MSEPGMCECGHYRDEHDEDGECQIEVVLADGEGGWFGERVPCVCFHFEQGGDDE